MLFERRVSNAIRGAIAVLVLSLMGFAGVAQSTDFNISPTPLFLTTPVKPLMMLAISRDHQLYYSAFPDYADFNQDGRADGTYIHAVDYYGYFDSHKCYSYSSTNKVFTPVSATLTKYCTAGSGNWSGNFLNWVSMARIDVVRKILYGGYRSTDSASATVLERTYLPNDAHSWVKYYSGSDVNQLTPFTLPAPAGGTSTTSSAITAVGSSSADFTVTWTGNSPQVGDQVVITNPGASPAKWMAGVVLTASPMKIQVSANSEGGVANATLRTSWTISNTSRAGISFCNTTVSSTQYSQDVTDAPLIRVASGNYSLWAANERWQCRWSSEKNNTGQTSIGGINFSNGNQYGITWFAANANNPVQASVGLGSFDYTARVSACVSGLVGDENCKAYPDGNLKPIGLLQEYGDDATIQFGLMTGSYTKNMSGGVLRKNTGSLTDEVNVTTDGTFKVVTAGGIINTLNKFRLYGYDHSGGTYNNSSPGDDCTWGVSSFTEGKCSNWGNPQSEIFLETLRYYTQAATARSEFAASSPDRISGLTSAASWVNPLSSTNWCAKCSVLNFNASIPSYDNDQFSGLSALPGAGASVATLTDVVGAGEGIHGQSWFIGSTGTGSNNLCTAKTITSLGAVTGPCPEAPRLSGSFQMAGLANYVYTHDLRPDLTAGKVLADGTTPTVTVKTYGVTLAPAIPKLVIPNPVAGGPSVTILPACQDTSMTPAGNCALVDFKVLSQDLVNGSGSILVNWEDSEQGGDYDQDMAGILSYQITGGTSIRIYTQVFIQSTPYKLAFGYVISGTNMDGFHAHSGINGYAFTDGTGATGCTNCQSTSGRTSSDYTLQSSSTGSLKDPLFYAAKWGGYNKSLIFPTNSLSWDNDGDALPDNYYYAADPAKLATSMSKVFAEVGATIGSASAVAFATTSLSAGGVVYQARFNSDGWTGQLTAYQRNASGTFNPTPLWDTQAIETTQSLPTYSTRKGYTYTSDLSLSVPQGKLAYPLTNLTTSQQTALRAGGTVLQGQQRLDWILGDRTNESTILRQRDYLLGDIIHSNPLFVGPPANAQYRTLGLSGYGTFITTARTPMLYVGANDGMLHAFDAGTGIEKFAYIPNAVFANPDGTPKLKTLTDSNYSHQYFVDGSPVVGDATLSLSGHVSGWNSILVGTTGAGGKSVFALDVTNPGSFGASKVLWEFTDTDLGYTLGTPIIGQIGNTWVTVFGNGYNSTNNRAFLYVVNLGTGALIAKIDTGAGSSSTPNGLASPAFISDAAGKIITVYAGDILGNLWKFDMTNNTVAFSGSPLFQAKDSNGKPQPITAGLEIGRHPNGGYLVFFGTGKYFEVNDQSVGITIQSLYGIWDNGAGAITYPTTTTSSTRGSILQQQTIVGESNTAGNNFRLVSRNPITWGVGTGPQRGWYLDLIVNSTLAGERVIDTPTLNAGRAIFTTMTPYVLSTPCDPTGTSWIMVVDMVTGGRTDQAVLDVNRDSQFDASDFVTVGGSTGAASGFQAIKAGISKVTLLPSSSGIIDVILSGINSLTTTASSTEASSGAAAQAVNSAVATAQAATTAATTAAQAAAAAAAAKSAADAAAAAAPGDAALAQAAAAAAAAKSAADAAAVAANKAAAQAIVDAANAIITAATNIINAGGGGTVDVATANAIKTQATNDKNQATSLVTSGAPVPGSLLVDIRNLAAQLQGQGKVGVSLAGTLIPQKTWQQLR